MRVHGRIALCFVLFIIVASVGTAILGGQSASELSLTETMLLSSLGLGGSALLVYFSFDRKSPWTLGFNRTRAIPYLLQGAMVGLLLMAVSFGLIGIFGGFAIESANSLSGIGTKLLTGCILFMIVAVCEELFCRGYLQGLLKHHYGVNASILITSLLFSLLHAGNPGIWTTPFTLINIFLIGLFFALTRELTGSLWMPIGFHFAWNFSQGHLFGFAVSGTDAASVLTITPQGTAVLSGGEFGAEGSVVTTILILAVCLLATRTMRARADSSHFPA
nr:type II CAAX endopeptidase family protein [Paenibacillus phyllosphaerae]